ncbi:glycoside hydrolase family 99-like domain-containing protein [Undibacterium arcticum]|uniref:Glycoside hydrolase family 99-like domain-containing protein n=1 Tax=Undibacterium arcticum TaxID=1762892 RepID=A0ABV7FA83_9BURK
MEHFELNELKQHATNFNQAVAERDGQITNLNQAVAERDGQITNLNQAVAERDGQITNLNQAVAERGGQITNLNQSVTERDGQIVNLNHAVVEREGQIAILRDKADRIVIDKDSETRNAQQQLNQIIHSRSWRVTAPLRKVVAAIRQGAPSACMSLLGKIAERSRIRREVETIKESGLFDEPFYRSMYPDLQSLSLDVIRHYCEHGWREGRNPSANFDTRCYLATYSDIRNADINPFWHYVVVGASELRNAVPDSVLVSHQEKISNTKLDAEVDAIKKSGLFYESFYRSTYPDLQPPPCDAIRHYCEFGWREGRSPSDDFNTSFYLATYSDIRNAGINPFWHYIVAGASEMRLAVPDMATVHENDIWFGVVDTDIKLLAFYSSPDWATLRSGRPMFKGHSQPPLPHDEFGFYDPSDWRVLKHQAELAKRHGLYGFCFDLGIGAAGDGRAQPVDNFLGHDDIDFCFCVQAELPSEDALAPLVASIVRTVSDRRYIRIADRPLVLFTMPDERRCAASVLGQLRRLLADQGIGSPFLVGRWASASEDSSVASLAILCDAVLDLPSAPVPGETGDLLPLDKNGVDVVPYGVVASQGVDRARTAQGSAHPFFHCVTLGRDNTARKPERPLVYTRFHVRDYRRWLDAAIAGARVAHPEDRRFVFVNGWNDWNEGLFLEPDRQGGFCRVNETTRALLDISPGAVMPKVSVIVPNYNHEPFLRRRLDSIYGQTYKNIEVILLDDCSSDQSRSLMDQYAAAYPDITSTLYNDENSGSAFRQWAKGIKATTGDLIWIAESDDYCDERFLEVLVSCFEDEAVLLAYAKSTFVDKNEVPIRDGFQSYLSDLECAEKWNGSYVETAHNEVRSALGIKNTIPNASGVLFKRPINMPLLDDESWLSMVVAGDWVFYLEIIRGGKIAYSTETTNFFRRYEGSAAEVTYKKSVFYREVGIASRTVAALYNVPLKILEQCREGYRTFYEKMVGQSDEEFALWYDYQSILKARERRLPNVMVSTMGFFPGGAEILPIRLANEFKRQGLSVVLLNAGLNPREDGVRRMLRNDVPVIETSSVEDVKAIIRDFGVEVLNTHQWHIQKYPLQVPDVFDELRGHVASLHGMIEHGDAFGVTEEQLRKSDQSVTTWVYTAEKNLVPFSCIGLYDKSSSRFVKMPNGMQPPRVVPIPRADMGIPEDAFALCCVSRAIPDKGWAETIMVVERARALSGRDIRLILVGNGPVYDEYCRAGAPDFVYLAGFSENSVGHYAAADMGIMLTKFKSESFPLTIVDCLFAGKPYIASDVGDIRNMLTTADDIAGDVIELEDWEVPIERAAQVVAAFATDKQKYVNALALVQDAANRYHIDVVASQYVRLFESSRDEHRLRFSGCGN